MNRTFRTVFLLALLITGLASLARAHLMVAQKGTLNLSGNGAYLIVSVPTSALKGVDNDADNLLSGQELSAHASSITKQLQAGLQLSDLEGLRPLQGLMLSLSPKDAQEGHPADQLIVMGRYALSDPKQPLSFRANLWGKSASEQSLSLTITKNLKEEQLLMLSPQQPQGKLYESGWVVFINFLKQGIAHVLTGLDHLLFLLVVISAGWNWKRLLTALSVFSLGHGLSLMAIVLAGLPAPSQIVEPAIAATIVGLALYDWWLARRAFKSSQAWRLGLVFACSLIHGLGLGGALTALGINPNHQAVTLLGFNLGIELGQLCIAVPALLGLILVRQLFGGRSVQLVSRLATQCAVMVGGVWFLQRVLFF